MSTDARSIWSRLPNEAHSSPQPPSPSRLTETRLDRTRLSPSPSRSTFPQIAFDPINSDTPPATSGQPTNSGLNSSQSSRLERPPGSSRSASFGAYDTTPYRTSFQQQALSANSSPFSPPLSSSSLAPSIPQTTSSSSSSSTQPLLAEIFSGRPRPHFRSSTSYSHGTSTSTTLNNHQDTNSPPLGANSTTTTTTTTNTNTTPSYFAAPTHSHRPQLNRARSQSSAPTFHNNNNNINRTSSPVGASSTMSYGAPGSGYNNNSGLSQSFATTGADQHGWRPSGGGGTGGTGFSSASVPTTLAIGSPTFSSFVNRDSSSSPSRGGTTTTSTLPYSPFARPNSSLGGGGSGAKPGAFLSQSFSTGWEDFEREREGRARVRGAGGDNNNNTWGASDAGSSSLNTTPGTGLSPFSRDSSRLTEETTTTTNSNSSNSELDNNNNWLGGGGPGGVYKARRDYSLGAVGSGRKRSDSAWGGTRERVLRELDEDDEQQQGTVAPPTKSGATSRRHSFAAFEVGRSTVGFHLPEEVHKEVIGGFGSSLNMTMGTNSNGLRMGMGSSAIDDDDLAADFNSLHLSLDAHAKEQQQQRQGGDSTSTTTTSTSTLHVGSMPVDFPPARSRRFDTSRSPDSKQTSSSLLLPSSPKPPTPSNHGLPTLPGSPRATAEPFTPSLVVPAPSTRSTTSTTNPSTSVASRFFQAPSPLPPTTTNATATATPGSRFDFFGVPPPPPPPVPHQQQRFGLPPPSMNQEQQGGGFYNPLNRPPPPPSMGSNNFRGPPQALGSTFSPFAPSPYQSPAMQHPPPPPPPSHMMQNVHPGLNQPNYFAPNPPPLAHHQNPPPSSNHNSNSNNNNNSSNSTNSPALTSQSQSDMSLGRGVPLHAIPPDAPLCIIGFKAGRKDLFFCEDPNLQLSEGDLVIVEADRGRDVGKYLKRCSIEEVHKFQQHMVELALGQLANPASMTAMGFGPQNQNNTSGGGQGGGGSNSAGPAQLARMTKECQPKRIYAKAGPADTHALLAKAQDEVKALQLVRGKVQQKGLPMEILDAEWQWDRRKLTFYYTSDQRVDFRELVRELFRIWKTRVWLCCLDQQGPGLDFV